MTVRRIEIEIPVAGKDASYAVYLDMAQVRPKVIRVERIGIMRAGSSAMTRRVSLESDIGLSAARKARASLA